MFELSKERKIANKIKNMLNERGFMVKVRQAKKSKSIYIKIDNGACNEIRISDHKNLKTSYNCKYNMIREYKGERRMLNCGKPQIFYDYNGIGRLICDVETERSNRVIKYGYLNYKRIRDKNNSEYKRVA